VTEAIILAGGLGTRLRSAVPELPKAMAPIAGQPFLSYLLRCLEANGMRRIVLATGYRNEDIRGFFGTQYGKLQIVYSVEDQPLGTGGALLRALPFIEDAFAFVVNGDTFLRLDYRKMASVLARYPGAQVVVALRHVQDAARYGSAVVVDDRIQGFQARGTTGPGLINGGCYLVRRDLFANYSTPAKFSWEADFLEARAASLQPIAFRCDAPFIDIGVPEAFEQAQTLIPSWILPETPPETSPPEITVDARLGHDRLWRDLRIQRFSEPTPALFLDRDGVMVEEKIYLSDPSQVQLLPGIPELISAARARGMAIVEITNQAGIAHGVFEWSDFVQVENRLRELLAERGVAVDAVFACPFHEQGRHPFHAVDHPWRKPRPGMLLEAASLLNLVLSESVLVGDKLSDMQAGSAAGLAFGIHVLTGHGQSHQADSRAFASASFPVHVVENAMEALQFLGPATEHQEGRHASRC
jgi:D-glycero-alpha-D-manno-heptose 1-phosphate guanylyltransferase